MAFMRHIPFSSIFACLAVLLVPASSCSTTEYSPAFSADTALLASQTVNIRRAGYGSSFLSEDDEGEIMALIYNNDNYGRLDSYQKLSGSGGLVQINSGTGEKTAIFLANMPDSLFRTNDIYRLESLKTLYMKYTDENPAQPAMYGVVNYSTSRKLPITVVLTPLLCMVEIRFFDVDFSQQVYSHATLEQSKAYLINLNGFCPISGGIKNGGEILNYGAFDWYACSRLKHPELNYSENVKGAKLYFYPFKATEGLGAANTRLVIEGVIDGHTYYYSFDIGNEEEIKSGNRYVYDILLKRKGTLDPDIPASSDMMEVKLLSMPWEEMDYETEQF